MLRYRQSRGTPCRACLVQVEIGGIHIASEAIKQESDLAIPPGELLGEELQARGISQREFAAQTGRPVQAINEIIKGKKQITAETALDFERVLGTSASFWLNLESGYRLTLARNKAR